MKVNVLGTTYTLEEHSLEEDNRLYNKDGYFDYTTNECVVIKEIPKDREFPDEFNEVGDFEKYKSKVKRHELIHAFLKESGVGDTDWGTSEDMVNWLAEQFPKMVSVFLKANCLDADGNYENQKECEIPNPYDVSMAYFYHVGDCGTCIHCQANLETPGCCTDYGICLAGSPLFSKKVCGLIHDDCPFYEENAAALNSIKNKIKELETQL